jgi:uroporphyrinogen-III synthase
MEQSLELRQMLSPLELDVVVQPAFDFISADARSAQPEDFAALVSAEPGDLLIFTSPRAVHFGLEQIPANIPARARVAAIGPATAQSLAEAGVRVGIRAQGGYTSEDLLAEIDRELRPAGSRAFILLAPGGRMELANGLRERGCDVRLVHVYQSQPSQLDRAALARLESADRVLSVWTSGNTMKALSHRLSPAAWFRVCQGEWLVISDRLERLARAFGPAGIHLAHGPGNAAIASAIRNIV